MFKVLITAMIIGQVSSTNIETKYGRFKRGFAGMYETFGDSRQAAMDQMEDNQNIALWSAQSAVTSSIGQVYGHQQTALANTVQSFLIPMRKYQQQSPGQHNVAYPDSSSSPSSSSLSGKHTEKFTVEESKPARQITSRIPKEVLNEDDVTNGNQHRRDTNSPARKESQKKTSVTTKSASPKQPKKADISVATETTENNSGEESAEDEDADIQEE